MNELIDAIVKYLREGLDGDVPSLRDHLIGGMHAHLAPHSSRNPFCVVSCDTPEPFEHVMHDPSIDCTYTHPVIKFSFFTTVIGPDGRAQVVEVLDLCRSCYEDYLFDTDEDITLPTQRVVMAHPESRHVFADPDGGWTGILLARYILGDKLGQTQAEVQA